MLGQRYIYDGTSDLVLITQLVSLIQGQAEPQAQSVSNTADATVTSHPVTTSPLTVTAATITTNGPSGTGLRLQTADIDGKPAAQLLLHITRILESDPTPNHHPAEPGVSATWQHPNGTTSRSVFATLARAASE